MSNALMMLLLVAVPGLPLLLTIPALNRRLSWPLHIALLPAMALLFVPGDFSVELPWVLFGSAGMGMDAISRWWLLMSVVTWAASATLLHRAIEPGSDNRLTALFLLTLAGQLGAIVATNLVIFFAFTTVMGYAFVGLLFVDGDDRTRRAANLYLVLLIVADIILFEALLIAGGLTSDLGFTAVDRVIAQSPSPVFYLSMVVAGFALKSGFWPLHLWLPLAYGSARPGVTLLLWLVPVATGLLGIVRWIPLGAITEPTLGAILLGSGAAGIFYALLFGLMRKQWQLSPIYLAMLAMGVAVMGLGAGLVYPALWSQYGASAPVLVAALGLGLTLITGEFPGTNKQKTAASDSSMSEGAARWAESWGEAAVRWGRQRGLDTLPALRSSWVTQWNKFLQVAGLKKIMSTDDSVFQRWPVAIMLCLLLGVMSVVLLLLVEISAF